MDLVRLEGGIKQIKEASKQVGMLEVCNNQEGLLAEKIQDIKHVFLNNWIEDHLPFIKKFYHTVQEGVPTPVLSICGKGTQEIRFTKYLAYFLDSSKNHGLKDKLYKAILQEKIKSVGLCGNQDVNYSVEEEVWIGTLISMDKKIHCFCDIAVISDEFGIFIEQKILSAESTHLHSDLNQLDRYTAALKQHPTFMNLKQIRIYLTPDGRLPNNVGGWISLSHKDIIIKGMKLLQDPSLSKTAKENLVRFLMDIATGPYAEGEDVLKEMIELADEMIRDGFILNKFIRFRELMEENELLIQLIMEGV